VSIREAFKRLLKDPLDGWYYIQGNVRMMFPYLMSDSTKRVVEKRKELAKECYMNGECVCCGCDTPALFYCNKGCSANKYEWCEGKQPCYGSMREMKKEFNKTTDRKDLYYVKFTKEEIYILNGVIEEYKKKNGVE